MEIDLHGVKHEEVGRMLDTFIWEHMKKKSSSIRVVTGNSPEMKRIVHEIVNEYGFVATEGLGNSASLVVDLI